METLPCIVKNKVELAVIKLVLHTFYVSRNDRSQVQKKSAVCLGCQPGTETYIFTHKSQYQADGQEIPEDKQMYLLHDTVFGSLGLPPPPVKAIPAATEPLKTTVRL